MSYRMTFRFDEQPLAKDTLQVPVTTAQPPLAKSRVYSGHSRVRQRKKSKKPRLNIVHLLAGFFFVLLGGILLVATHSQPRPTSSVVPQVSEKNSNEEQLISLASTYQILILPPLHIWMLESGTYDSLAAAEFAVKANRVSGISSYATPTPPYKVLLSPLLTNKIMNAEKSRLQKALVPYYLRPWNTNQMVIPVPFYTGQQAGVAERQLLQNYSLLNQGVNGMLPLPGDVQENNAILLQHVTDQKAGAMSNLLAIWSNTLATAKSGTDLAKAAYQYWQLAHFQTP